MINEKDLKEFLDEKVDLYLNPNFIADDPIRIPHSFNQKEDIEISAFLSATIAWGRRSMIMKNANHMMNIMDGSPHQFILHASPTEIKKKFKLLPQNFSRG